MTVQPTPSSTIAAQGQIPPDTLILMIARRARITSAHAALVVELSGLGQPREVR